MDLVSWGTQKTSLCPALPITMAVGKHQGGEVSLKTSLGTKITESAFFTFENQKDVE